MRYFRATPLVLAAALAACGGSSSGANGDPSPSASRPPSATTLAEVQKQHIGDYRLTRLPVLTLLRHRDGPPGDPQVFARFDRRVPASPDGDGYGVFFAVQGSGNDSGSDAFGVRKRRCYTNLINTDDDPPFLTNPQDGDIVPLEITIAGIKGRIRLRTTVHIVGSSSEDPTRDLGCRRR
jgi:hypothetical protein